MEMFLKHSNNPEKSPNPDMQALKNLNRSVDLVPIYCGICLE